MARESKYRGRVIRAPEDFKESLQQWFDNLAPSVQDLVVEMEINRSIRPSQPLLKVICKYEAPESAEDLLRDIKLFKEFSNRWGEYIRSINEDIPTEFFTPTGQVYTVGWTPQQLELAREKALINLGKTEGRGDLGKGFLSWYISLHLCVESASQQACKDMVTHEPIRKLAAKVLYSEWELMTRPTKSTVPTEIEELEEERMDHIPFDCPEVILFFYRRAKELGHSSQLTEKLDTVCKQVDQLHGPKLDTLFMSMKAVQENQQSAPHLDPAIYEAVDAVGTDISKLMDKAISGKKEELKEMVNVVLRLQEPEYNDTYGQEGSEPEL